MKSIISHQLSTRQLDVLQQLGDILAPGYGQLPSFSETGCLHHIDEVLDFTSIQNIKELKGLLTFLSFLPPRCIPLFITSLNTLSHIPGFIGQYCRLGFWGVKGLVFSLYYSNLTDPYQNISRVHDAINYHVSCQPSTQSNVIIKNHQES